MPPHPHQALAVYAEPLVVRRRVVVLGDDHDGVADRLTEVGARMVVTVRPGEDDDDLRPASFDLALIPDLGVFEEPPRVLARARRLVGEAGAVLVAAANRDVVASAQSRAFDYYELFDLVAREFTEVTMVAQVPFHGLTLAELGTEGDSPPVTVDAQLVEDPSPPTGYVALGSHRGAKLEPYVIVEVPGVPSAAPADDGKRAALEIEQRVAVDELRAELEVERARAAAAESAAVAERKGSQELLAELGVGRAQLHAAAGELAAERERGEMLGRDLESLRGVVLTMEALEREVAARGRALVELSAELEETRAVAEAGVATTAQLEALAQRTARAERALTTLEPELALIADRQAEEIARLEDALRDRAMAVRALEGEVARRDRMVRELAATLGDSATAPGTSESASELVAADNARLREKLDAMARDLARRQAEGQASAWALTELERRLAEAGRPDDATRRDDGPNLRAALDEIDALRKALVQEHDLRVRAETASTPVSAAGPAPSQS